MTVKITRDCAACGGDGWLPSLPEGQSDCPYCRGTGRDLVSAKQEVAIIRHAIARPERGSVRIPDYGRMLLAEAQALLAEKEAALPERPMRDR